MALTFQSTAEGEAEMGFEDCSRWHHLIYCEEFVSDKHKSDVNCKVCKKSVQGRPAYKCLECDYVQHKSCPDRLNYHMCDYNRHHLIFVESEGKDVSMGCREPTSSANKCYNSMGAFHQKAVCMGCGNLARSPAYKCHNPKCSFLLHESCIQIFRVMQHHLHPDNTLILKKENGSNGWVRSCSVCRKATEGYFYRCTPCKFYLCVKCIRRFEESPDNCSKHEFLCLRNPIRFTCDACGEESKGDANQCSKCLVLVHRLCTDFCPAMKIREHDYVIYGTYSLRRVRQVNKQESVVCNICCRKINTECGAYYCQGCDFVIHMRCKTRATVEDRNLVATDNSEATKHDDYKRHLVYLMEELHETEDDAAALQEIAHFSHPEHKLTPSKHLPKKDKHCEACMQPIISAPFYGCEKCDFFLHWRCAELPKTFKRLSIHRQPLNFQSMPSSTYTLFWCSGCQRVHHGFSYRWGSNGASRNPCKSGGYWDVQCLFIPEIINHTSHEHSLYRTTKHEGTCQGCRKSRRIFVCPECPEGEFQLCFTCVTIPLVARSRYDAHLLKLTYTSQDDYEEYYCLVCEKKRNPKKWFYSCDKCEFTAHINCILGRNPCLKSGTTIGSKNHSHRLVPAQTTDCVKCHACGKHISEDHVALECPQCKLYFHFHNRDFGTSYSEKHHIEGTSCCVGVKN